MIRYDENGVMIPYEIEGAKGGSSKPHTPVETPNNLLSVAYAKVLLAVAEGELAGTPTAKDIYLDGTPLQNEDGSMNFGGVKWEWRSGSQDQAAIEAFPEVSTEYSVGLELKDSVQWTRAITKSQLTDLRVTFQWPALMEQASNGDTNGYKMQYAIDISTNGGAFQEYQVYTIEGKTNTAYERTHKVKLPKPGSNWTIRARRVTPENNSSTVQDTINVKSYAEVVAVKQRYPNTALLYVEFDSRLFGAGSIPKISVKTKGRVIQVPSNYNPTTRVYSGIWDGSFKWAWTDNPAWVFYDLLTQDRFGLGHKVTPAMVDKLALYEIAQYCDVMVDDGTGSGTMEPRHTCNVFIQDKAGAWKVLRDIAGIFNGMTYWDGNKFVAVADKWEPITNAPLFSRSNVVNGMFDYQAADDKSIYTSALVSYDDPDNHYNTDVEPTFETSQILRWGGDRQTEITAIGCTSRGEAQRKGKYTLITNLYNRTVSFQTGLQGLSADILPGKLIHVLDPLLGGRPYTGRIKASAGKVITLDRDVTASAGDILYLTMGNGLSEGRTIVSATGNIVTVSIEYSKPIPSNSVWYLESSDLKSQLFRVTKVTNPSSNVYEIEGVEYNESKYDAIDNGARLESRPVSVVPPGVQKAPTNLVVSSSTHVEQTMAVTSLVASWDQMPNAVQYEVQWRFNDGDWVSAGLTGANTITVKGIYTGNYVVRVRAINAVGIKSVWTSSVSTPLNGKTGLPPSVASLVTTGMLFGIRLDWTFPNGATDTLRTEIMYSQNASFASAIKLGDFSYPTDSHEMHGLKAGQQFWFWARLVDRSGNVGPWKPLSTTSGIVGTSLINDNGQYNDYFAGLISNTALDKTLYDRIELIDGPVGLPGSVNNRLKPISDSVTAVNGRVDGVQTQVNAANTAIAANKADADAKIASANTAITAANTKIDAVNSSLSTQISTVNTKVDGINTDLNNKITTVNNRITTEVANLQNQINNIEDALEYDPAKTYVKGDIVRSGNKLYQAITAVGVNTPPPNAAKWKDVGDILEEQNALALQVSTNTTNIGLVDGKVTATTTRLDAMSAAFRDEDDDEGDLNDALKGWDTEARIGVEQTVRANADEALSERITLMTARVDGNEAKISTIERTVADNNSATAERLTQLQAGTIANNASLTSLEKVVADANKATTERLDGMSSDMGTNKASITTLEKTVADNNGAMTQRVSTLESKTDNNSAQITEILNTVVTDTSALVEKINQVDAKVGTNTANITSLTQVVADNNSAMTTRVDGLTTTVGNNTTKINSLETAFTNEQTATASKFTAMQTQVDTNKSSITSLSETVTTKDTATNQRIDNLTTTVGGNTASITSLAQTVTDNNTAMTTRVDGLTSTVGTNTANITNLTKTVTDNNTAITNRVDGLTSTVNTNTGKISTLETTTAADKAANATRFQTIETNVAGNTSSISSLQTSTSNADAALGTRIDNLTTTVNGNSSAITNLQTSVTTLTDTTASQITSVNSKIDKEITDRTNAVAGEKTAREAAVSSEATTRANADSALGVRIDTTNATVAGNTADIQTVQQAQASLEGTVANITTNLSAVYTFGRDDTGDGELDAALADWKAEANYATEVKARSDSDEAMIQRVTNMEVNFNSEIGKTNASITEEQLIRARADSAIAQDVIVLKANMDVADSKLSASIEEERVARVNNEGAVAQQLTALTASVDSNTASIISEAESRTTADTALGVRIDQTNATVTTEVARVDASVASEVTARTTADTALGSRIDTVTSSLTALDGTVQGQATSISNLQTSVTNTNNALTVQTTRIDGIFAQVNPVLAGDSTQMAGKTGSMVGVWTEQSARIEADIAIGKSIDNVQASIGSNSAAIQQISSTTASLDGKASAAWALKMEVNSQGQYVAAGIGLGIENGPAGLQSSFLVRADNFAVVNGTNTTTTAPFVVSGGQVFIADALINKATITNALIGSSISSQTVAAWAGLPATIITFAGEGAIVMRNPTRANSYCTHTPALSSWVVDGVTRVRIGSW